MTYLLTIPQAAQQLAISRSRLYELMQRGTIPFIKIGSSRRLVSGDIEQFIHSLRGNLV